MQDLSHNPNDRRTDDPSCDLFVQFFTNAYIPNKEGMYLYCSEG